MEVAQIEFHLTGDYEYGSTVSESFMTTSDTLLKYPNSTLAKALKENVLGVERCGENEYQIERDPAMFTIILNYMRSGKLNIPWMFDQYGHLKNEAAFYNLPELVAQVEKLMVALKETINVNVGGVRYSSNKQTLTSYPDSMLGRMFGGSLDSARDYYGYYFIDRDGKMFLYIMNFLRTGSLDLPQDFTEWKQLRQEADFYQLGQEFEKALAEAESSMCVYLRADEECFRLERKHVEKYQDSPLFKIFNGVEDYPDFVQQEEGVIVLNRDGKMLKFIVNYLKDGNLGLPWEFNNYRRLCDEAKFFKITDLVEKLT